MAKGPKRRVCSFCHHEWMAPPPGTAPAGVLVEVDPFGPKTAGRRARLQAEYIAQSHAHQAAHAAFNNCPKCGSAGTATDVKQPIDPEAEQKRRAQTIRVVKAVLSCGYTEYFRFGRYVFNQAKKWWTARQNSA
jgi:hypothetical protein